MPALDLIRPSVSAMRVIASVNDGFARELKLPPHIRSLGLITADSDDVTYIAADEATKQAMVEVVYGRSLYAGAAHGPSPTAGEVLIMLGAEPGGSARRSGCDGRPYRRRRGVPVGERCRKHGVSGARGVAYRFLSFVNGRHCVGRSDGLSGGTAAGSDVWH